jgi:hypothetical protein
MHQAYELAAQEADHKQPRVPWAAVPEANKIIMRKAVGTLLDWLNAQTRQGAHPQ